MKKYIPFKIKAIKYLGISLIRVAHKTMAQDLHEETYKTLVKDIKPSSKQKKRYHVLTWENLI